MLFLNAALIAAIHADVPSASIALDPHGPAAPLPHLWSACLGSGHAALTLREDWRQQVRQARHDLGVEAVRFHGILNDEMSTSLGPGRNSFVNVDSIVDFLLSQNMHAVWELGFMPSWLANTSYPNGNHTIAWYKGNPNPPLDWDAWGRLVGDFASHLVERYGEDEMAKFPFVSADNFDNFALFLTTSLLSRRKSGTSRTQRREASGQDQRQTTSGCTLKPPAQSREFRQSCA
jgi:hypothetical protein